MKMTKQAATTKNGSRYEWFVMGFNMKQEDTEAIRNSKQHVPNGNRIETGRNEEVNVTNRIARMLTISSARGTRTIATQL